MNEKEQIKKLAGMIDNSNFIGDNNIQIAEMALTMALHWNKDTQSAAPEMYAMLEEISTGRECYSEDSMIELLAKARG